MQRGNCDIRYSTAQNKAYEVLLKYSGGVLPIDPFKIVKKIKNLKIMTFTEFAIELQKKQKYLSLEEIKCQFESDRGFLKKKGSKQYILVYNEYDPDYIIRWTIFHELGHYFLGHLEEDETQKYLFCNGEQYKEVQEKEANCFARHCSSPLPVVLDLYLKTSEINLPLIELFKYCFNMSKEVAGYCSDHFNTYWRYYAASKEIKLVKLFEKSVDGLAKKLHMENC